MIVHAGRVEFIEQKSSGLQFLVVAGDTILIEQGALGSSRSYCSHGPCWDGCGLLRAGDLERSRPGYDYQHGHEAQQTLLARLVVLGARAANAALTFTHLAPKVPIFCEVPASSGPLS
jgi:hypothetical protein